MSNPANPLLDPKQVAAGLPNQWQDQDGWLLREYRTDGWRTTMFLVNAIAFLAEQVNHHPDLEVHWGRVVVRLQSHDAGGITQLDLDLATRIEVLATGVAAQSAPPAPGWLIV